VDLVQAVVLGLVQGLTEFLPVSSSGHLVVVPALLGWEKPPLAFDVAVHLGTLGAVVVYYRRDLAALLGALFAGLASAQVRRSDTWRLGLLLVAGSVPAAAAGLLGRGLFEAAFETPLAVAIAWLVTAAFLAVAPRGGTKAAPGRLALLDAVVIGCAQALALFPGISRSGATVVAGLFRGLSPELAPRFAFLLAVPAILGAGALSIPDFLRVGGSAGGIFLLGAVIAGLSGYLAIASFVRIIARGRLYLFTFYLVPMAALALWLAG
jgi:undecaprenyl-diphosphatase